MHKNRFSSRSPLWMLLGVGAGVVCLGAIWRHKRKQNHSQGEASEGKIAPPRAQPGDILLFHKARGVNKIITGFTGSPFYHSALYVSENKAIEARMAGVLYRDMHGEETKYVVIPAPEGKGAAALEWALSQLGDAYDKMDLVVIVLDRLFKFIHFNYTPDNKFSCGEFVAAAYDKAGVRLVPDKDMNDVVPGDFAALLPGGQKSIAEYA